MDKGLRNCQQDKASQVSTRTLKEAQAKLGPKDVLHSLVNILFVHLTGPDLILNRISINVNIPRVLLPGRVR